MSGVVAIIPARGGSKGVPRKNLASLAGKPLIVHSIEDARTAKLVDRVVVSTDDAELAAVSLAAGAEVIERPLALAGDTASSESALQHALGELERTGPTPELIVFLQCTSPVRTGEDVDGAIRRLREAGADSLLSVSPNHRFLWEERDGAARPINYDFCKRPRRQEMHQYVENGSMYVFKPWVLKQHGNRLGGTIALYVMGEDASWEIDSHRDFEFLEMLLSNSKAP